MGDVELSRTYSRVHKNSSRSLTILEDGSASSQNPTSAAKNAMNLVHSYGTQQRAMGV